MNVDSSASKQAVHAPCPKAPFGGTHHLLPRKGGMVCEFCTRTQRDIESELNS